MSLPCDIAYSLAAVVSSPVWGYRLFRTGKWRTDWRGRFGHAEPLLPKLPGHRRILFHAVSVGEVNLIEHLVRRLAALPDLELVIATTTDTGFARAVSLYGKNHPVLRYPLDFTSAVRRFLNAVQPDLFVTVELEVWPNMVQECSRRSIPVAVVNGRLSQRSISRYRLIKPLMRPTFAALAAVGAQDQTYAAHFREMGVAADRLHVLDTMKWDTSAPIRTESERQALLAAADQLAAAMGIDRTRPVVVLGSTGEDEERRLLDALLPALDPRVQIVVVPRKPERFDEVAALMPGVIRRTLRPDGFTASEGGASRTSGGFLVDTMGELGKVYALADVVIVGRSFNGWGASDPIEPVALSKPTIIGPDHQNFREVVAALASAQGIIVVPDPASAAQEAARLLADPASASALAKRGQQVILTRRGATARHLQLLLNLLNGSCSPSRGL